MSPDPDKGLDTANLVPDWTGFVDPGGGGDDDAARAVSDDDDVDIVIRFF